MDWSELLDGIRPHLAELINLRRSGAAIDDPRYRAELWAILKAVGDQVFGVHEHPPTFGIAASMDAASMDVPESMINQINELTGNDEISFAGPIGRMVIRNLVVWALDELKKIAEETL